MKQEELVRERDFYRAKLKEEKSLVKTLRFECAELQKRDVVLSKRLSELANKPSNGYRPRYRKAG